jgi:hypothetical protein
MTTKTAPDGRACGVTFLGGGPSHGGPPPAFLRTCPSGSHSPLRPWKLVAADGAVYTAYSYGQDRWSAELPAGTYRVIDAPACPAASLKPFTVKAGETTFGVILYWGCLYS